MLGTLCPPRATVSSNVFRRAIRTPIPRVRGPCDDALGVRFRRGALGVCVGGRHGVVLFPAFQTRDASCWASR